MNNSRQDINRHKEYRSFETTTNSECSTFMRQHGHHLMIDDALYDILIIYITSLQSKMSRKLFCNKIISYTESSYTNCLVIILTIK